MADIAAPQPATPTQAPASLPPSTPSTPAASPPAQAVAAPAPAGAATPSPQAPPALPENFRRMNNAEKLAALRGRDVRSLLESKPEAKPVEVPTEAPAAPEVPAPEVSAEATLAQPTEETPAAPVEAPAEEAAPEPKGYSRPEEITKALEAIPDPKLRSELKHTWRLARDYRALMPISEVKQRLALDPTLDGAVAKSEMISAFSELRQAYSSGTPEGLAFFLTRLHEENPGALKSLVTQVAEALPNIDPDGFLKNATRGWTNLLGQARRIEQATGKTEWTLAELDAMARPGGPRPPRPPQADPVVQQLQEQNRRLAAERFEVFFGQAASDFDRTLSGHGEYLMNQLDPDKILPPEGRRRLLGQVLDSVSAQVRANPVVSERTQSLLSAGRLDQAHSRTIVDHLMSYAERLLGPQLAEAYETYVTKELRYAPPKARQNRPQAASELVPAAPSAPLAPRQIPNVKGKTSREAIRMLSEAGIGGRL